MDNIFKRLIIQSYLLFLECITLVVGRKSEIGQLELVNIDKKTLKTTLRQITH